MSHRWLSWPRVPAKGATPVLWHIRASHCLLLMSLILQPWIGFVMDWKWLLGQLSLVLRKEIHRSEGLARRPSDHYLRVGSQSNVLTHSMLECVRKSKKKEEFDSSRQYPKLKTFFFAEFSKINKRIRELSWLIIIFAEQPLMRFGDLGMLLVPDEIKMRIGFSWETGYNLTTPLFLLIRNSRLQFRKIIVFVCLFSLVGVRVGMVANRLSDCQKITKKLLQLTLSLLSCQKICWNSKTQLFEESNWSLLVMFKHQILRERGEELEQQNFIERKKIKDGLMSSDFNGKLLKNY